MDEWRPNMFKTHFERNSTTHWEGMSHLNGPDVWRMVKQDYEDIMPEPPEPRPPND